MYDATAAGRSTFPSPSSASAERCSSSSRKTSAAARFPRSSGGIAATAGSNTSLTQRPAAATSETGGEPDSSSPARNAVTSLAVAERRVQLARLGVDEVGREVARVAAKERVREGAVAPEETAEVQAHEQSGERVQERAERCREEPPPKDDAVRERVVEVARDEDGGKLLALPRTPVPHDRDGRHRRQIVALQAPKEPVLALADLRRKLLQRVVRAVSLDEADDVTSDPALELDDELRGPPGERKMPGEVEKARIPGAGDETERRARHAPSSGSSERYRREHRSYPR